VPCQNPADFGELQHQLVGGQRVERRRGIEDRLPVREGIGQVAEVAQKQPMHLDGTWRPDWRVSLDNQRAQLRMFLASPFSLA